MTTIHFDKELFAEKFKAYRGNKSQKELSEELDIGRSSISLLENGKQSPSLDTLKLFCQKISADMNTFFYEEQEDPVLLLMGKIIIEDEENLLNVVERIKIREHYIAIDRRERRQ